MGQSPLDFDPVVLDPGQQACAQILDIVPTQTLTAGYYRYEIGLYKDGKPLDQARLDFEAVFPSPSATRADLPPSAP